MKKLQKLLLLLGLLVAGVQSAWAVDEIYARINTAYHEMELHYDDMRLANMTSDEISILAPNGSPGWWSDPDVLPDVLHVQKIIFYPGFENAPITSTHNWFKGMPLLTTLESLHHFPTTVTDMSNMFQDCKALTNLDLSELPVNNVTNMCSMFDGCYSLTSLNLSGWNTAKLTNMNDMFHGCSSLASLNVSGWTNTMFTNMSGIFSNCYALTSINLTNFNTSAATNMSGMFSGSNNLTSVNLSSFNTSNVTNMSNMFSGCSKLTNVVIGNSWNTSNVTNMSNMFYGCSALGSQNLSLYDVSSVTNMSSMFKGCSNLGTITFGNNWNVSNVTDMSNMFEDCSNLTTINLSKFNTTNVTNMSSMFKGCSSMTSFTYSGTLNTRNVTDMSSMFEGCSALTSFSNLGLASWNVAKVTTLGNMFKGCSSLTSLTLNWYTSSVIDMGGMFSDCSNLSSISFGSGWNTSNVNYMGGMFSGCSALTSLNLNSFNTSNVMTMNGMFEDCSSLTTLNLTGFDTSAATSMNGMFRGCSNLTTINGISSWNTSNVTLMCRMFKDCSALTSLNLTNWNTSKVKDLNGMFQGCNHLTTIYGIEKWKTPSLGGSIDDNLDNTFKDCSALTSLDLSGWNTSGVSHMNYMFSGCSNLVTLNLGGWDTSAATDMEGLFENCSKLTTIYVGNGWTVEHLYTFADNILFANCTSLVGGKGTRWSSSHVDKSYAHIDALNNPGYLTETPVDTYAEYDSGTNTLTFYCDALLSSRTGTTYYLPTGNNAPGWSATSSAVTNVVFDASFTNARPQSTYRWFRDMGNLSSINGIENLNTSQVTTMSEMFYGCTQLVILDLTGFSTSNVTDMSSMFRDCSALTRLDLTGWSTYHVTGMSNMFANCSALKAIYVNNLWSAKASASSNNMFYNCTQIVGGYGTLYDESHVDATYAHIDASDSPGYLRDHSQEHTVNLVLVAGACNKGIEVWSGNTQVGSISQEGGTFSEEIVNAINLQLRVPNEYLEKIILNSTDVTATLPSTTTDDPAYAGYTFYTIGNLTDVMVIEVQYNDNVPVPFATSQIRFDCFNGTGSMKNMKIWFKDGTSTSDNIERPVPFTYGWLDMRTVSKIEITMKPVLDNFTYAQQYNTLGTIVNNGDGTYFYTIPGENLTSSIVPLYFPTSDYGSVKTLISSRNNIKLGYYFGELAIYDAQFLPQYTQENSSLLNSEVTIMHKDNAEPGWDRDQTKGIIYVQVTQGTTFRLVEDGVDYTEDCIWYEAGLRFNEIDEYDDYFVTPVAGYYYLLKNVTTDSYIVVDNGNGEIVSPWQVLQTIHVIGDGSLSLRKGETEVESISEGEPTTVSWTTNDNLTLAVTLPNGADIANYEAILFIDGTDIALPKVDGAFATYDMGNINTAHNIVLITRQVGGFASTGITWTGTAMGELLEDANVFEAMLNDDSNNYRVLMLNQRYSTFSKKFNDNATSLKVTLLVKDGYDFKVYFNGEEFPHTFTKVTTVQDDISVYSFETTDAATIVPFLVNGTWTVEFKAEVLRQSIQLTGEQLGTFLIQYLDEDGADYDDAQADNGHPYYTFTSDEKRNIKDLGIYVNVPQGYTFKASFNGEEVTGFTLNGSNYTVTLDETFVTDGTWVVEFKKASPNILVATIIPNGIPTNFVDYKADRSYSVNGTTSYEFTPGSNLKVSSINTDGDRVLHYYVNGVDRTEDVANDGLHLDAVSENITIEIRSVPLHMTWRLCNTEHGQSTVYFQKNGNEFSQFARDNTVLGSTDADLGSELRIVIRPDEGYEPLFFYKWQRYAVEESSASSGNLIKKSDGSYEFLLPASMMANEEYAYFTVIFKRPEGITWEGMIIGDVPQGAVVDLGLDGMTMEVFLNAEETSSSDTYTDSTEGVGMDAIITVPTGYNFKIWFNGEEKTDKFDETGAYHISFNNPTELAPYLQDGQWIILFYDDVERYDVNRDGQISIADVTKLVNKILGKD